MKDPGGPQGGRGNDAEARDRSGIPEEWLAPFLLLCLRDGDSYGHRIDLFIRLYDQPRPTQRRSRG